MDQMLMCISIRQPWADFVIDGIKTVENRTWRASFTGPLLIHASKSFDDNWKDNISIGALKTAEAYLRHKVISSKGLYKLNFQKIIGIVIQTGCDVDFNDPWCIYGMKYHRYSSPRRFSSPIKCQGKLKLYTPLEENFKDTLSRFDITIVKSVQDIAKALGLGIKDNG